MQRLKNLPWYLQAWLFFSLLLFHIIFFAQKNVIPLYVDLLTLTVYAGYRAWKAGYIPHYFLSPKNYTPYFIVMFGMVLLEEFYAALVNSIQEGFIFSLFIVRIGQFWAFNILIFSGAIIGLYLSHKYRFIIKKEAVIFVTIMGLYTEKVYVHFFSNPLVFVIYAPVILFIYYIIFAPGVLLLKEDDPVTLRGYPRVIRYIVTLLIIILVSIPFMGITKTLREQKPNLFPPCSMIPC